MEQNSYLDQQEQEVNLKDYYRIIKRHFKLIFLMFIVVLAATIFYTIKADRIYESTGKVLLEMNKQGADLFMSMSSFGGRNELNNQMQVIQSRPIISSAIEKLKRNPQAANFPILTAENPVDALTEAIDVSAEREVDIFKITYKSTNPLETQAAVNAIIGSYQEENLTYSRAELTSVREFLEKQLDKTSKRLSVSEEDLRNYKILHKTFALSEETKEMITNMGEFEGQLQAAKTEFQVAKNRLDFQKSNLAKIDSTLGGELLSISSPLLEQLRTKLIENESKLSVFLTKEGYTSSHPKLKLLKTENNNIRNKMKFEMDQILKLDKETYNPLERREQLLTSIVLDKVTYESTMAKVKALQSTVEEYQTRMSALPDAEIELARLERSKTINETIYSMLISKYEEAKIAEEGKLSNIRIIQSALLPKNPVSPKVKMNILIGIILGLGLGAGLAFLLENLNTKISTLSDVERFVKLSVLGTIPNIPVDDEQVVSLKERIAKITDDEDERKRLTKKESEIAARLITHTNPKSPIAESYRTFRTNLVSRPGFESAKTFLITSSGPKEGKSTSSSNLAITLAQMNSKTVIVDCDMRRPMQHNLHFLEKENGLSKYLQSETCQLSEIIKHTDAENLDIITSGHVPTNPSELLASPRMDELLDELKKEYDYVLLDSPPIIAVTDALILAKKVDALVLVLRVDITDKDIIEQSKKLLDNVGVKAAGVLVNGIQVKSYYSGYKYYYYYYYYYYYSDDGKTKKKRHHNKRQLFKKMLSKN
ncbi:MAG: polysaccharide biosynthesis tyrosine autokinase [Candidatus Cloacimonadota bacterium]|nr:polysaccharide biosynthesis tyrosine autokinase [Candidatus Cloacimonadota bacterium]